MASTHNNNHEKEDYGSPSAATATDQGGSIAHRKRQPPKKSCINCRKSHTACDPGRPCKRCIKTGNEATCCDAPQRKKGRKPLNKAINGHSTSAHSFMQAATVLPSPAFFPSEGRSLEQQQTILQPQHYHHARHQQQQSRSPQQQHLFSMLLQQQRRPTTLPLPREDPTNRFSDQHTTPLSSSLSSSSAPTPSTSATRSTAASGGGSSYSNSSDYCSSSSLSSPECIDEPHTNHQTDSGSSRQHPTVATSPRFSYGGVPFSPLDSQRNFPHGHSEVAHAADASSPNSHNITHKRPFHHLNKERNDDEESEDVRSGYQQRSNHHQHQHHHHGLPFSQSQSPGHPHTLPPPLHHHFYPLQHQHQHQHQHQQQYSALSDSKRRKTVASDNGVVEGSFSGFGIGGTGSKVERLVEKAVKRNTKKLRRELKKLRRDNEQIMHQLFTMQSTLVQLTQRLPSPSSAQQQPPPTPQQSPLQRQQQISEQQRPTNGSSSGKRDRSHVEAYSSSSSSSAYLYLNEGQLPEDLAYNSSFISSLFASQFGTMSPRPSLSLPPSLPAPSDTNTVDHFRPIPSLQTTDSKAYAFIRFIKPHMQPGIVAISKGWSLLFEYTLNEVHGKTPREVGFIPAEFGHWAFHEFSALMEPPPPGSFTKCYRMRCIFQSKSGKRFEATTTHIILFAAKLGKTVMERAFCIWDDISTSITPSIHHYLVAATERLDRTCHCQQQVGGFCSGRIMTDDSSTSISPPPFSFSPAEASSTTSADDDEEAGCSSSGESLGKPDVGGGASCGGGGGPPLSTCSSGQTPAPSSSLCMTTTDAPPSSGCLLPAGPCPTSPQPFDALLSLSPSFYPVVHES